MRSQWSGHSAVTRKKLLTILERAADGSEDFSVAERALYSACEFWAAVESRTLEAFLGPTAVARLRQSIVVFSAIGATEVAGEVEGALDALVLAGTNRGRAVCIERLQEQLRQSTDPLTLNDLIAGFAQRVH